MKINSKYFIIIFILISLYGCTTTYNSLNNNRSDDIKVIAASESEILRAAFNAISAKFPTANIIELSGYQTGFTWFHMPMLDSTDFKLTLQEVRGLTDNNVEIQGYSVSINTYGTQGLVKARYIDPLITKFDEILFDMGIQYVNIKKVTHTGSADSKTISKTGTGFFVSNKGHIITNHHVVKDSTSISIILTDGRTTEAKILSSDPINDIALLKAEITNPFLKINNRSFVNKGAEVLTLGYPLPNIQGQEQKATFGRVNALSGVNGDIRFLQIDIPIQPGNSGGPLLDKNGEVVGIITASLNALNVLKAVGSLPQGVNYAIKSDYIMPLLRASGIQSNEVSPAIATKSIPEIILDSENSVGLIVAK